MMTTIKPWVRDLTESILGGAPFAVGDRVMHPEEGLVEITSGQFWGERGLSNSWCWKKVLSDGTLDDEKHHGYGWRPEKATI